MSVDKVYALFSMRLYFGYMLLIPIVSLWKVSSMEKVFIFAIIIAIFEKILIVFFPNLIFSLPNYHLNAGITFGVNQAADLLGGMHSIGGNRTVSAVLFLAMGLYFATKHDKKKNIIRLSYFFLI